MRVRCGWPVKVMPYMSHFALVPVGVGPDTGGGGQVEVALGQGDLDHHVTITLQRHQVVEHAEVGARQAAAMGAQPLVDAVQVVEHHVGLGYLTEEGQDFDQSFARNPEHRHAGTGGLDGEGLGAKANSVRRRYPGRLPCKAGCTERSLQSWSRSLSVNGGVNAAGLGPAGLAGSSGSHFVGAAQVGHLDALLAFQVFLGRHFGAVDPWSPTTQDSGRRSGRWIPATASGLAGTPPDGAAGDVDVHGEELVDPWTTE